MKKPTRNPSRLTFAMLFALAKGSEFLGSVLGGDLHTLMLPQAEREIGFFNEQVTPVELNRYIENF